MLPSIAPRQDRSCALCGRAETVMPNPEAHHMIPRSLGGTETILLCVECHQMTEGSDPLIVGITDDYVFALRKNEVVVKRWLPRPDFHEGLFIRQLQTTPHNLRQASTLFRFLSDEGLKTVAATMADLEDITWYCLAQLFREAILRSPYGSKKEKLESIAKEFGLKNRQAYKYIAALEVLEERPELGRSALNALLPSPDALLLIKAYGDPEAAIALYVDRITENPSYSSASFRQELAQGNTDSLQAPPQHHKCPLCGQWHLVKESK